MTNSDPQPNETDESPQIVVDSDWKEQVAKEKETLAENADSTGDPKTAATNPADSSASHLPPASFEVLVSMLFTQGMSALGQIPMPGQDEPQVDKPMAKHSIDTLEVLSEKTQGNLSDTESKMLAEATHALRMAYVSTRG
ncbi:DUF1844 domain-containing protein [Rhodopirellula sp. JC740]|uniref:DUF1844 domain-containing protein n=1 Tax=Rhodopirellula halodulae TaxID=2894198 RepID=A0ABS8NGB4_9BACT|nr:DUF1844 domain-containing protein [Rhodopirellula sp. JC740]MCC9642587.1 DUF1844 domain-containing protein [Rhodopirellula sp. JC740]